jgi:prepilin-type N-terminal cleavage/methylation domain-containing protein
MNMRRDNGITMTELMAVIVILGILFSIAYISYAGFVSRTKLRTSAFALDATIRHARWMALSTLRAHSIRFDTSDNSYVFDGQRITLPTGLRFGISSNVKGCPGSPGQTPPADGISFGTSGTPNTLNYSSTGEVVPAGTVYITDQHHTMAIRVSSVGRPRLWRTDESGKWIAL